MSKSLFTDFEQVTAKSWKQKIQADLKGLDYNDTLVWQSLEGIDVKPFYHSESLDNNFASCESKSSNWNICQTIFVTNETEANQKALNAINKGAESLKFVITKAHISLVSLLSNIDTAIPLYFELQFLSSEFVTTLNDYAVNNNTTFYLFNDIIGNLAKSGNWYSNLKQDHEQLEQIVNNTSALKNKLSIDVSLYQNAGANITQQLAYALAQANEYLNHFNGAIGNEIVFNVTVGTNYFFEIAKLKALRILWNSLAQEYNRKATCHIITTPSKRNKTIYDYNTNMLRTTTECMSAILGGADTIDNLPYDAIFHKDNEFGERISRNQLLILKNESYLNKVSNPTDGAYYIENLTHQLAEKALELFKDIERQGGLLAQLKEGTIQRKIKEAAQKEQQLFDDGKEVLLGTNKHPNPNDKMKNDLELYPFVKTNPRKTLIEPIIERRLAETMEQNRLGHE